MITARVSHEVPTFTLKCVGCKTTEDRPASECREQPFCKKCFMPMVLEKVRKNNVNRG